MTKGRWILLGGVLIGACIFDCLFCAARIPAVAGMTQSQVSDESFETPLTNHPGESDRGRSIVLDRERGDCVVCHAMPLPNRQFHGTIGPPLDGVGNRYSASALRLRLVDPKRINPQTIMPAYYRTMGLNRVAERYRGKPILTTQEIEDVVAYLLTLR